MSYLAMLKQAEARAMAYREALRTYRLADGQHTSAPAEEARQELYRLLDELGVPQALVIRRDELARLDKNSDGD